MPGLNYGTAIANPSLGLGVFSAIVAVVTLSLSVKWVSFTTGVCAGHHIDANLLLRVGDEITDVRCVEKTTTNAYATHRSVPMVL